MDFSPLFISLKVAFVATLFTFLLGLGAARLVVGLRHGKGLIDGIFTLPLVLPPTIVGFFLLMAFGKHGFLGEFLNRLGISVVFSWIGAVIASIVVSFPIMYCTCRGAFEQIDMSLIYAARTLGMTERQIFFKITLPNSIHSILAGTVLAFARALGEFGATIMIAGNIPGKTETMAVAVYIAVQSGRRELAYKWVAIICIMSFATIIMMNWWTNLHGKRR